MSARDSLLTVLAEAASQDPARMQSAVTQLQQWEATPQFNATLQVHTATFNGFDRPLVVRAPACCYDLEQGIPSIFIDFSFAHKGQRLTIPPCDQ